MLTSRILTAIIAALLLIMWIPLDRLTLDDIPRRATRLATSVNNAVIRETSVLIRKLGFTEVQAERVVAAPASPQRKPTRSPIRSVAPTSDATHQPTSGGATVAPPGGPADIDDSSEPIVVASEAGVTVESAAGEDGSGADK